MKLTAYIAKFSGAHYRGGGGMKQERDKSQTSRLEHAGSYQI